MTAATDPERIAEVCRLAARIAAPRLPRRPATVHRRAPYPRSAVTDASSGRRRAGTDRRSLIWRFTMKPIRRLDPTHVLNVCAYAAHTRSDGDPPPAELTVTMTPDQVTVHIADQNARAAALRALQQVGYNATLDGDAITVRGWSHARLQDRLARLDGAVQWLVDELAFTPRTAVDLFRQVEIEHRLSVHGARSLARTRRIGDLRDHVQAQAGPLLWQDPQLQPPDPRTGMLLRQCRCLEDEADLLLGRHRAIATQAIAEHRTETARAEQPNLVAAQDAPATSDGTADQATAPAIRPDGRTPQTTATSRGRSA